MVKLIYEFTIEDDVLKEMWRDSEDECSFREYVENVATSELSAYEADELASDSDVSVDFCD